MAKNLFLISDTLDVMYVTASNCLGGRFIKLKNWAGDGGEWHHGECGDRGDELAPRQARRAAGGGLPDAQGDEARDRLPER